MIPIRRDRRVLSMLGAVLALALPYSAHASTLLVGTEIGTTTETRATDFNPNFGNGILASVIVGSNPVTIDQFGLHGKQEADGSLRFSIFDASTGAPGAGGTFVPNLTRVYDSGPIATPAGASLDWLLSPIFSLTLDAGKTYYMGIISDQTFSFSSSIPAPAVDFGLGLSMPNSTGAFADRGRNGNFGNFSDPIFTRTGWSQISAQVYGTPAPVPLPAAIWLFGSGVAAVATLARRRRTV